MKGKRTRKRIIFFFLGPSLYFNNLGVHTNIICRLTCLGALSPGKHVTQKITNMYL